MNVMLTADEVRQLLDYSPETGLWTRRITTGYRWKAGSVVGSIDISDGYLKIYVNGKLYLSHRLAWLYVTGEWPNGRIDHINGVRTDNRICNLRESTASENGQNRKFLHMNNTSGETGVSWHKQSGKWQAYVTVNRKRIFLGCYERIDDAVESARNGRLKHHPRTHISNIIIVDRVVGR